MVVDCNSESAATCEWAAGLWRVSQQRPVKMIEGMRVVIALMLSGY